MADICCRKCGEPADVYFVYHEMDEAERIAFLSGQGCECCGMGTKCPQCRGTGHRECESCRGKGYWMKYIRPHYSEATECIACAGTGKERWPCETCKGTGKPTLSDEGYGHALSSLMNSDEDPTLYL